jgi:hypothetical protein
LCLMNVESWMYAGIWYKRIILDDALYDDH